MTCEVFSSVLQGVDHAPYIPLLLIAERSGAVCRACGVKEVEKSRE